MEHIGTFTPGRRFLEWGENAHGELRIGTGAAHAAPVEVHGGLSLL